MGGSRPAPQGHGEVLLSGSPERSGAREALGTTKEVLELPRIYFSIGSPMILKDFY